MLSLNQNNMIVYLKYTAGILAFLFVMFIAIDNIIMPLYVNLGKEVDLPDVTQKSDAQAILELRNLGLMVGVIGRKYNSFYPEDTVLSQNPIAGTRVKTGRAIELTVSRGDQKVKIPDLINLSPRDAELRLQRLNLIKGEEYYNFSDDYTEGIVISQSYESGTEVTKGTIIDITVSLGLESKEFEMPDVRLKTLETASETFRQNRLRIGGIIFNVNDEFLPNTVLFQDPQPGMDVSPGDSVIIIVSRMDSTRIE